MTKAPGTVLVVNGTSGSGKSTTCEMLAERSSDFWLLHGIDHFISGTFPSKFGHHGPRGEEGFQAVPRDAERSRGGLKWEFGPAGMRAMATFHEWAASSARQGCNIAIDHLLMTDPPLLQDLAWRLEGLPTLLVTLRPPLDVLEQRVASRTMTKRMPPELGENAGRKIVDRLNRLRPWFYEAVYANDISDLTIDTSVHSPEEVEAIVGARLREGPGTAFEELRQRWPKPGPYQDV